MDTHFWKGRKVLVTGHTGFKGSWLSLLLQNLGSDVVGISLPPNTNPNLFTESNIADGIISIEQDIRDSKKVESIFSEHQPEVVFHLAAQALVRRSYSNPVETYSTNVMGTLHILEAIRKTESVRSAVIISSDKCYENREWEKGYKECDSMGGFDPYSSSKGCVEILTSSYRNSFFSTENYAEHKTAVATARTGNVIGGGDWSEDRLIPDILHGFQHNQEVKIRNPKSTRPWQHVIEPLVGYLDLAHRLFSEGPRWAEAWNFGPKESGCKSVEWIVKTMATSWGTGAKWSIDGLQHPHEAHFLKLDCSKAESQLNWDQKWELQQTLQHIVNWHQAYLRGEEAKQLCLSQINEYMEALG